jgi:hypothetical protein
VVDVIDTVLVLPTPPALLPPLSREDPVAELREACRAAVAALPQTGYLMVLAAPMQEGHGARIADGEPLGHRVARHLLGERPFMPELALPWTAASLLEQDPPPGDYPARSATLLVMADGSARRGEKAPGHLHPDAEAFDASLERALRDGDAEALAAVDQDRARELWCQGAACFQVLGEVARGRTIRAQVTYADAPYGVAWWVARWDLAPPAQ